MFFLLFGVIHGLKLALNNLLRAFNGCFLEERIHPVECHALPGSTVSILLLLHDLSPLFDLKKHFIPVINSYKKLIDVLK